MKFRKRTLESLGDLVCGNPGSGDPGSGSEPKYFPYRSSMAGASSAGALLLFSAAWHTRRIVRVRKGT
ncbi:hypothetical protein [Streptomyces sp. NPDC059063]|uniref:hypothetical protein n=1 Tax=unclassified Streptomyces TaxID=2593676 RepID=UPI0036B2D99E